MEKKHIKNLSVDIKKTKISQDFTDAKTTFILELCSITNIIQKKIKVTK